MPTPYKELHLGNLNSLNWADTNKLLTRNQAYPQIRQKLIQTTQQDSLETQAALLKSKPQIRRELIGPVKIRIRLVSNLASNKKSQ